jgi:hypothetical protein
VHADFLQGRPVERSAFLHILVFQRMPLLDRRTSISYALVVQDCAVLRHAA